MRDKKSLLYILIRFFCCQVWCLNIGLKLSKCPNVHRPIIFYYFQLSSSVIVKKEIVKCWCLIFNVMDHSVSKMKNKKKKTINK